MNLTIDTTEALIATFTLSDRQMELTASCEFERGHNDRTLAYLQKFLAKHKTKPDEITRIIAYSGPGSYTGVRLGVTIAQALGFAWNIPVRIIKKK